LVDTVPDLAVATDQMLGSLNLPQVGEAGVRNWVGNGAAKLVARSLTQKMEPGPLDAGLQERAMELFLGAYEAGGHRLSLVYPGVRELLLGLEARAIPLVVVTNKPERFVSPLLEQLELRSFFSLWLGGDSLPAKKPDPGPLLHVAKRYGVPPEACLMVGDSRNDVLAAQAAGMPVAAVTYGYNHGEPIEVSGPDLVVEHLDALLLRIRSGGGAVA
jgi:phosphoglycolate phosphatase